ncbi:hypothetical protein A2609_01925 [Candidatus Kaiserbacteria bacterium RIFOXYD1_FULL_47_14]|uniref:Uncharacterized protein n=1 Tax=Candidatus Kaiserbacteria bacterium RIFOXYD1_FULL_47_14 TaxID=1798533 RepID=A0A1F6G4D8_9BACT|nr:MAG: hypothetical protein A2609_01925 [Candidatus Kaiserbacteria bacterium RIFOXYD1_FULL_47_14]
MNGFNNKGEWSGHLTGVVNDGSGCRRRSPIEYIEATKKEIEKGQQKRAEEQRQKKEAQPMWKTENSSGCFIATAAYGTPLAEEINLLRRFRDEQLARYRMGQAFIASYYRLSPPIAEIIEQSRVLRSITRAILRPIIWLLRK